jgi:hypothetical protein
MSDLMNSFNRRRSGAISDRVRDIKRWTRDALCMGDEIVMSVGESSCTLAGCNRDETSVLLLMPDRSAIKLTVHKPITEICKEDVIDAAKNKELVLAKETLKHVS